MEKKLFAVSGMEVIPEKMVFYSPDYKKCVAFAIKQYTEYCRQRVRTHSMGILGLVGFGVRVYAIPLGRKTHSQKALYALCSRKDDCSKNAKNDQAVVWAKIRADKKLWAEYKQNRTSTEVK